MEDLAKQIGAEDAKVAFLVGAGISVSAGIPDYRTPGIGLYERIQHYGFSEPELIFNINELAVDSKPYYHLFSEEGFGAVDPTPTHFFFKLLDEKKKLHVIFTQNIDNLERKAGVEEHKVILAHGGGGKSACVNNKQCHSSQIDNCVLTEASCCGAVCNCYKCGGVVKETVVFYGEQLPTEFASRRDELEEATVAIVMGTSLKVAPFNYLPGHAQDKCPLYCVTVDTEIPKPTPYSNRKWECVFRTRCDNFVAELVELLGWKDDFQRIVDKYNEDKKAKQQLCPKQSDTDKSSLRMVFIPTGYNFVPPITSSWETVQVCDGKSMVINGSVLVCSPEQITKLKALSGCSEQEDIECVVEARFDEDGEVEKFMESCKSYVEGDNIDIETPLLVKLKCTQIVPTTPPNTYDKYQEGHVPPFAYLPFEFLWSKYCSGFIGYRPTYPKELNKDEDGIFTDTWRSMQKYNLKLLDDHKTFVRFSRLRQPTIQIQQDDDPSESDEESSENSMELNIDKNKTIPHHIKEFTKSKYEMLSKLGRGNDIGLMSTVPCGPCERRAVQNCASSTSRSPTLVMAKWE